MSCVIAFFFSGLRRMIVRTPSPSVTVTCPVMVSAFRQSAMAAAVEIPYIIRWRTQSRGEARGRRRTQIAQEANDAAYRDTSSDRDFGEAARESGFLYRFAGYAAGQE